MPDWSLLGWEITAGGIIAACLAVAWFFPPFRKYALLVAAAVGAVLGIYRKGYKDREALEIKRKEEAVQKARADYEKIDNRGTTPDDAAKRLRDGSF